MSLAKRLERAGWLVILGAVLAAFLVFPVTVLDLMGNQQAFLIFIGGGMLLVLFCFLLLIAGLAIGMDEGGVSSIPDEDLTPEQRLRKQELALEEQRQRQEGAAKAAQLFFGGGSGDGGSGNGGSGSGGSGLLGGGSGTKNERDTFSVTDNLRQTRNKYSEKYLRSPKWPNCGSQATAPTGSDEDVFQCDKCGNIFETRSRTRRDVTLDIED